MNRHVSDVLTSSTGSPQGCVLSPLLYILHTNDCRSQYDDRFILKFADDSVIISLLHNSKSNHGPVVDEFIQWCDDSFLQLNISKTKDVSVDFRRQPSSSPTITKGQVVESVERYKYLGTFIDMNLNFNDNTDMLCKKGQQYLYCLRKLLSTFFKWIGPS